MPTSFQAIYERGILRPLEPMNLKDNEVVLLSIVATNTETMTSDEQIALRQRSVLLSFVEQMESQSDENPSDGFSNRDHDRLIYGK